MKPDWRGEWLSLKDFGNLLGKSYDLIRVMHHRGYLDDLPGIRIHRVSNRVWVQMDRDIYQSLT